MHAGGLNFGPIQAIKNKTNEYNAAVATKLAAAGISSTTSPQILPSGLSGNYYNYGGGGYALTAANSPYSVSGDVMIDGNSTIEAGVIIKFLASYRISFMGNLIINGTSAKPVKFTSGRTNPAPGDYGSVQIGSTDNTNHMELNYAVFEYGSGQTISGDNTSSIINCSVISPETGYASYIYAKGTIKYCEFRNLYIYGNPAISYCNVKGIINTDNNSSQYSLNYSNLTSSIHPVLTNSANWTFDLTNNWWGVTYSTTVATYISSTVGTINYTPIAISTITTAGVQ